MPQKKKKGALSPEDAAISMVLMNRNRDKNFVQRAYNNDTAPRLQTNKIPGYQNVPANMYSTELMSYDINPDGTGRVYPEIVQKPGDKGLTYLGGDKAWDYADSTGQYITTPNAKTADMLSEYGYKKATGVPTYKQGGQTMRVKILSTPKNTPLPANRINPFSTPDEYKYGGAITGPTAKFGNRRIDTYSDFLRQPLTGASIQSPYKSTGKTLPKEEKTNHKVGQMYDVSEEYAEKLRNLGYEFNVIE